ncbi:MAG TPA: S8 family peptidase, partial [Candidatus Nitrosotenuis sp.]|nr:S8 family peptidase [Candidatus Nitrosotenuis sp.]
AVRVPADQVQEFVRQARGLGLQVNPDRQIGLPGGETPRPVEVDQPGAELNLTTGLVGARQLWKRGITGRGVTVAVIDTGVAPHPDLKGRVVAFHDEIEGRTEPYDDHGHGTHVSGTVGGDGKLSRGVIKGIAPEAQIVGIKVLDRGGYGTESGVIAGVQWAIENKDRYNIRVINMSLGASVDRSWKDDPLAQAVEAANRAGIVCCVAAGNSGPFSGTIDTPGFTPGALTLGAMDDGNTPYRFDDRIPMFSSRGPTPVDGLAKPDVVAPGTGIIAATGGGYQSMSGTSMATPVAAGVAALLLQAHPQATPDQIKAALMDTAHKIWGFSEKAQGRGVIDAEAALARLDALRGVPRNS